MTEFDYLSQRWGTVPRVCNNPDVKFPVKAGEKLPNGGIILAETIVREFYHRRDSIVFCVVPKSFQAFVTWHRIIHTDAPLATGGVQIKDFCDSGEYFSDLNRAVDGYWRRVEEHATVGSHD